MRNTFPFCIEYLYVVCRTTKNQQNEKLKWIIVIIKVTLKNSHLLWYLGISCHITKSITIMCVFYIFINIEELLVSRVGRTFWICSVLFGMLEWERSFIILHFLNENSSFNLVQKEFDNERKFLLFFCLYCWYSLI